MFGYYLNKLAADLVFSSTIHAYQVATREKAKKEHYRALKEAIEMSKQIEWKTDGKYQTRDGKPAKYLCTDKDDNTHFLIDGKVTWRLSDGCTVQYAESLYDVIPVPKKHSFDLRMYESAWGNKYLIIGPNWSVGNDKLLACKTVEFTEGEGL